MMSGWQRVFLDDRQVPIMIKGLLLSTSLSSIVRFLSGDEVIGYDDLQSMELKVGQAFIAERTMCIAGR